MVPRVFCLTVTTERGLLLIVPDGSGTILAEYLEASGLKPSRALATGLVYAIRSETQDFGREAAGPDHAAFDGLLPRIDRRMLARIQSARLPLVYFRNLHRALENLAGVGNLVVSTLGEVDQPDIVPEIADLLLRMEGKTWSLCTGSHADRVYASIRTTNIRADAGNLMRRLIGTLGKGGGHGTMAGGFVALPKTAADGGRSPLTRPSATVFPTTRRAVTDDAELEMVVQDERGVRLQRELDD
mgnify:CR=1 FL=1